MKQAKDIIKTANEVNHTRDEFVKLEDSFMKGGFKIFCIPRCLVLHFPSSPFPLPLSFLSVLSSSPPPPSPLPPPFLLTSILVVDEATRLTSSMPTTNVSRDVVVFSAALVALLAKYFVGAGIITWLVGIDYVNALYFSVVTNGVVRRREEGGGRREGGIIEG
jgi:hypothetical protein